MGDQVIVSAVCGRVSDAICEADQCSVVMVVMNVQVYVSVASVHDDTAVWMPARALPPIKT